MQHLVFLVDIIQVIEGNLNNSMGKLLSPSSKRVKNNEEPVRPCHLLSHITAETDALNTHIGQYI